MRRFGDLGRAFDRLSERASISKQVLGRGDTLESEYEELKDKYSILSRTIAQIRKRLKATSDELERYKLQKQLDELEKDAAHLRYEMSKIVSLVKGKDPDQDPIADLGSMYKGLKEYLHHKALDHPTAALAAKIGAGALAAGAGALALRKLWRKYRQKKK